MGAGKGAPDTGFLQDAAKTSKRMIHQTAPARKEILSQFTELMKTGGVHAKIPMIQQAVSQANQALSGGMQQTAEQLASHNLGGGSLSASLMAYQRQQGAQQVGAIPTMMAQNMMSSLMPFVQGTQSLGLSSLIGAGQGITQASEFQQQQIQKGTPFGSTGSTGLVGGLCFHPDTEITLADGKQRKLRNIEAGDLVLSEDAEGRKISARVYATGSRYVGHRHPMLVIAPDCIVSLDHPMPDGSAVSASFPASPVVLSETVGTEHTRDIGVDSDTGIYFVHGIAFGSTLDERFVKVAA